MNDIMRRFVVLFTLIFSICTLHAESLQDKQENCPSKANDAANVQRDDLPVVEMMNKARLEQEEGRNHSALKIYENICKRYGDSPFAPEACYQIGQIRKQKRQYRHAFKAFDEIITKYPQYPSFNKVVRKQFDLATLLKGGSRPYYFGVIPGFKDYVSAVEFYENIIKHAPYNDLAPLALVNISELALANKKPAEAIDALDRLMDGYPDSEYAPCAYLKTAQTYAGMVKSVKNDQGATLEALHYYEDFLVLYPNHSLAKEAKQGVDAMKTQLVMSKIDMGDFYFQSRNNPKAAIIMYEEAAKSYPGSEAAALANEKISYVREGNLPKRTPVDFLFGRYKRPTDELIVASEANNPAAENRDSSQNGVDNIATDILQE
ncbi:MAG: outer membrane protein assembly factor BamD [Puniceicoccales bacterium]|nr:outer membrane protein assembly factor BamD [Puniceicoccales bacterium]